MKIKLKCSECGGVVERTEYELKKSKSGRVFCNRNCSASFNNRMSTVEKRCLFCNSPLPKTAKKYCNPTCQANYKAVIFGEKWKKHGQKILTKTVKKYGLVGGFARRYVFIVNDFKCSRCDWTHDFGDGSLPPLHCAHRDGNWENNDFDNIELLCPNCHSIDTRTDQTAPGNGRSWRKNYYNT